MSEMVSEKSTRYYGVLVDLNQSADISSDVLSNVRREFFETGKTQKNSFSQKIEEDLYKYTYSLSLVNGLKWMVFKNNNLVENVVKQKNGDYYVQVFDRLGNVLQKTFFNKVHKWLKTNYFCPKLDPNTQYAITAFKLENEDVLLKYLHSEKKPKILYKCNKPKNDYVYNEFLKVIPRFDALALTNNGVEYFALMENKVIFDESLKNLEQKIERIHIPKSYLKNEDINNRIQFRKEDFNIVKNLNSTFDISTSSEFKEGDIDQSVFNIEPIYFDEKCGCDSNIILNTDKLQSIDKDELNMTEKSEPDIFNEFNDINTADKPPQEPVINEADVNIENTNNQEIGDMLIEEQDAFHTLCQKAQEIARQAVSEIEKLNQYQDSYQTLMEENAADLEVVSSGATYYYYGEKDTLNNRSGYGKTVMENGKTAYDGQYKDDMRNGLGTFYYKNGNFCYYGNWENNKKSGMGVCRRDSDGVLQMGKWNDDTPVGLSARSDSNGNITYVGTYENGKRNGIGVTFDDVNGITVSKWCNGVQKEILYTLNKAGGDLNG